MVEQLALRTASSSDSQLSSLGTPQDTSESKHRVYVACILLQGNRIFKVVGPACQVPVHSGEGHHFLIRWFM